MLVTALDTRLVTTGDIRRYLPLVHRVVARIRRLLPSSVDLDDLVAAGLEGLHDALRRGTGHEDAAFACYAQIRIRGAILDSLRDRDWAPRAMRDRDAVSVVGIDDLGDFERAACSVDHSARHPEDLIDEDDRRRLLASAIARLPSRERTIVHLHYVEERPFCEIATMLSVSRPRVCQLLQRAIARLRDELVAE